MFSENIVDSIECEPFREKGFSGFLNRMKDPKDKEITTDFDQETEELEKPEKEQSKFKKFFNNLFKKRDRKKKESYLYIHMQRGVMKTVILQTCMVSFWEMPVVISNTSSIRI